MLQITNNIIIYYYLQKTKEGLETTLIVLIVVTCTIYGVMIARELVRNTRRMLMNRFYTTALKTAPKHELAPVKAAHDEHATHDAHGGHGSGHSTELFEVFDTKFLFGCVRFIHILGYRIGLGGRRVLCEIVPIKTSMLIMQFQVHVLMFARYGDGPPFWDSKKESF